MDDETLTVNIVAWQALLAALAGRREGQECSECIAPQPACAACLCLSLASGPSFPDPHTVFFFIEALKEHSLCSARLNSFLPLEAWTAWP